MKQNERQVSLPSEMERKVKHLTEMVEQHKRGNSNGIYAVCSAHPLVLEAAIRYAHSHQSPLLIEAPPTRWISLAAIPA